MDLEQALINREINKRINSLESQIKKLKTSALIQCSVLIMLIILKNL